jgi:hypothetical protein
LLRVGLSLELFVRLAAVAGRVISLVRVLEANRDSRLVKRSTEASSHGAQE